MVAIAAIGFITILFGLCMLSRPALWAQGIVRFSQQPSFHLTEIALRVTLGAILLGYADQTAHQALFSALGYLMLFVAAFLLLLGADRHRRFALRSSTWIGLFRPGGLAAILFGVFTVASALGR